MNYGSVLEASCSFGVLGGAPLRIGVEQAWTIIYWSLLTVREGQHPLSAGSRLTFSPISTDTPTLAGPNAWLGPHNPRTPSAALSQKESGLGRGFRGAHRKVGAPTPTSSGFGDSLRIDQARSLPVGGLYIWPGQGMLGPNLILSIFRPGCLGTW